MTDPVTNRIVLACIAAVTTMALGCNTDSPGTRSNGLVSSPSASFAVGVTPASMPLIPMARASCPMTQPFTTSFDLFARPSSDDMLIDGLTLRFIDGFGARTRLVFSTDDLVLMFGDTKIQRGTHRSFALRPQFGCGLSTPRSVEVLVDVIDARGGRHQATSTATLE